MKSPGRPGPAPRRFRSWIGAALAALAALSGLAAAPAAVPPPADATGLPARLDPLPAALASRMEALSREAERWRGLAFQREVKSGTLAPAELRRWIDRELQEELPPARLAEMKAALAAFGFIPENLDLGRFLPELLTEQIGGFYDTEREVLVLVGDAGSRAAGGEPGSAGKSTAPLGPLAGQVEEAVLVHELTHALQDQVFHLPEGEAPGLLSDGEAAREALVEGDATLAMFDFLMGTRLEDTPGAGRLFGSAGGIGDMGDLGSALSGMPGTETLAAAPPYFRETLLFSYFQGLAFCADVKRAGGQRLLDYAFAKDPPRSTEQVIHPEKWHGRRDDPVAVAWPDLAAELPGWRRLAEGELGELGIGILLRGGPDADRPRAVAAAAGWGGDRFAVYEKGGKRLLLWVTEWDSPEEAAEFAGDAGRLGRSWKIERQAPTRVTLLRGDVPAAARAALLARLAAARAERPANRDIDLAALGIPKEAAVEGAPPPPPR